MPPLIEYAFGVIKGTTQGNVLSVICTVELSKPYIKSNKSDPVENKDPVVLTCEPQTQNTTYLWSINNQDLMNSSRLELSQDHRTLILFGVTRNDTGPYECEARNPVSARRSDPLTLNVLCEYRLSPLAPGCSPNPRCLRPGHTSPSQVQGYGPDPWTPRLAMSSPALTQD